MMSNRIRLAVVAALCAGVRSEDSTLVQLVQATQSLSKLFNLVGGFPDIVEALSGPGPFTVFAPTDAAFEAISGDVANLDNATLKQILLNHVVEGKIESPAVTDGAELETLSAESWAGLTAIVTSDRKTVKIVSAGSTATVTGADNMASNGVAHIIDTVLLPPAPAEKTIAELAQSTESLSTLYTAVVAAGLGETLAGEGPFTVFAPTNDAFSALGDLLGTLNEQTVKEILLMHVVPGKFTSANILEMNGLGLTTAATQENFTSLSVEVTSNPTAVKIISSGGEANVVAPDQSASNGVVHVINRVLLPESGGSNNGLPNLAELASSNPALSTLVEMITQAGLLPELQSEGGPLTVFVPTNDAFEAIADVLAGLTPAQIKDILLLHIVRGLYTAIDISDGLQLSTTATGSPKLTAMVNTDPVSVKISSGGSVATVTGPNNAASNGVAHVIDTVLLPKAADPTTTDATTDATTTTVKATTVVTEAESGSAVFHTAQVAMTGFAGLLAMLF